MYKINKIKIRLKKIKINCFRECLSKGQSSIEFILVIPLLIIIILIVSQLGYLVFLQNTLEQAAREGTRMISTTNSNNAAKKQIYMLCQALDESRIEIKINPCRSEDRTVSDMVRITIYYRYGGPADFLDSITGREFLLKSSSMMRMECN
jgi:hypothetical protein